MALADDFDMTSAIKHDILKLLTKEVPIMMLTGSLSVFDETTTRNSSTKNDS